MVIASIDIQNGKVVQLKQGAELILQRENAGELAEEFDRYGEVAVIDLDAAMGKGSNIEMIKPLLRKAECRVGGGVRTPEQAKELVSLGARKIIVGSSAFRDGGKFAVNVPFLEAMAKKIGRERLIVAVDARGGEIVVDGWKTPTGLDLFESAKAVEPFAGELLFTCVEREGTMTGIDLAPVRKLREAVSCQITVAGGVSTLAEIEEIAALGCDVQLGMALYTGKINLADAFNVSLNWKKGEVSPPSAGVPPATPPPDNSTRTGERVDEQMQHGVGQEKAAVTIKFEGPPLLPLIVQSPGGQILMTGFTDASALAETFKRGNVCFHSRTRNKLWMKGENSGNILKLLRLRADCDRDALLATAQPAGPVCHTGAWSCFANNRDYTWQFLQDIIAERFRNPAPGSYTATLDDDLVREKIMEEAKELCEAKARDEIVWEAADILYFSTVLMTRAGVTVQEILDELDRRHKK
ncbi:MAG: phosphoribosyl-ATP diphosphatase [Treponema sp.]|jgi:phosphoribosyl-ATP pyrophosphohydrolase/phosphoribosyl-AMP cyclohydrolase|nr:phosphoribosyl-ATP diphosphatase [Treponema sp.]